MYRVSKDRRFTRNRDALQQAFIELALEKPFPEITVTDIAKRAGVNRMTFYSHYECINDIFYEMADQMVSQLEEHASSMDALDVKGMFSYADRLRALQPEFFKLIAFDENYALLRSLVKENIRRMLERRLKQHSNFQGDDLKVCAGLLAAGICGSYWDWVGGEYGDVDLQVILNHFDFMVKGAMNHAPAEAA